MKVELLDYQREAAEWMLERLHFASAEVQQAPDSLKSISLSAPTGAGKTVIAAAVVEAVLRGSFDGRLSPHHDPQARFLWLTDSPQLNQQTLRRFLADTGLESDKLIEIDEATFTSEQLPPGALCFINTQKLGEKGRLSRHSDQREHTFWDAMDATLAHAPGSTIVLLDEAHRGMTSSKREAATAQTIMQRFLVGHHDAAGQTLMRAPQIVVGISATPRRFRDRLHEAGRSVDPYEVKPEVVRSSGLLKQQVRLVHTPDEANIDTTLARAAAARRREFADAWKQEAPGAAGGSAVRPALLIQVEDSANTSGSPSATDLDAVIDAVDEANHDAGDNRWADSRFAHCFETHQPIRAAGREIRYLEPAAVADDPDADIVLFKTALNTGWDCPRAEVLISYRTAKDHTNIAQLVGRMVRAPLRRRIDPGPFSDLLNGVDLYLPRFDDETLDDVVEWLTGKDIDDATPALPVEAVRTVDMGLAPRIAHDDALRRKVESALSSLPTYDAPPRSVGGPIPRLRRLGELLERNSSQGDPVLEAATDDAREHLTDALDARIDQIRRGPDQDQWDQSRQSVTETEITTRTHEFGDAETVSHRRDDPVRVTDDDLERRAQQVDRQVGWGIIRSWIGRTLRGTHSTSGAARDACADVLAAFHADDRIERHLQNEAERLAEEWHRKYKPQVDQLPDAERLAVERLMAPPLVAQRRDSIAALPDRIHMRRPTRNLREMRLHLYVEREDAQFTTVALNGWEHEAVEQLALGDDDTIAWFRNERSGSRWHLAIPYQLKDTEPQRLMFPDIVVLRSRDNSEVSVQVIDPHSLHLADAPQKLHGLARWAQDAADDPESPVTSVIAVAGIEGQLRFRDLMDDAARGQALNCQTVSDMVLWFDQAPGNDTAAQPEVSPSRERNDDPGYLLISAG